MKHSLLEILPVVVLFVGVIVGIIFFVYPPINNYLLVTEVSKTKDGLSVIDRESLESYRSNFVSLISFTIVITCLFFLTLLEVIKKRRTKAYKYDVFLASPMLSAKEEYSKIRKYSIKIKDVLTDMGYEVYYAGDRLYTEKKFHKSATAIDMNLDALLSSKYFMMYFPKGCYSRSIQCEAFAALSHKKNSIYLVHNSIQADDLAYMIREAYQNQKYARVKRLFFEREAEIFDQCLTNIEIGSIFKKP